MKVLTIQQPWATLIMLGAKKVETRSWNTTYRGPLLIHASASMPKINREMCYDEPFSRYISHWSDLPVGKILGKATLLNTLQSRNCFVGSEFEFKEQATRIIHHLTITPTERYFGDYSADRYGWWLTNIQKFKTPIPAKGQLGLWEFDEKLLQI